MNLFSEECKTCKILQEALEFERARNKELTETLTSLIKPQPIIQNTTINPANPKPIGLTFTRRRMELEKADRLRTQAENGPHAAKPDKEISKNQNTVEQLEKELGVVDSEARKEGA